VFPELICVKGERGLNAALREAARRERQSLAEFARRALRSALQASGVELPPFEPEVRSPDRRAA
jgi:hypothetical protein